MREGCATRHRLERLRPGRYDNGIHIECAGGGYGCSQGDDLMVHDDTFSPWISPASFSLSTLFTGNFWGHAIVDYIGGTFSLTLFLSSGYASFAAPQDLSIAPQWSADLATSIGESPIRVIGGGNEHEYEYKPKTSLWFTDNNTVVATFVAREGTDSKLSNRKSADEDSPLRLRAAYFSATSGKILATPSWPASSRFAAIVAAHDGKVVTLTGNALILYSPDLKRLKELALPQSGRAYMTGRASPTGKSVLFTGPEGTESAWIWVDTDDLQIVRSWQDTPLGRIAMTSCISWFFKCEPAVQVRGLTSNWKTIAPIADRHHPGTSGFVDDDLLAIVGRTTAFLRPDGTKFVSQNKLPEGCWWGGVFTAAGERRFVIPSCKLKGRNEPFDIGGSDELLQILVYDAPYQEITYTLSIKEAKIKDMSLLALSPDGSKMAILNGESIYLFALPPPK